MTIPDPPEVTDDEATEARRPASAVESTRRLIREEFQLAAGEVTERARSFARVVAYATVATVLIILTLGLALQAAALGVSDALGEGDWRTWLGFCVAAVLTGALSLLFARRVLRILRGRRPPSPQMAIDEAKLIKVTGAEPRSTPDAEPRWAHLLRAAVLPDGAGTPLASNRPLALGTDYQLSLSIGGSQAGRVAATDAGHWLSVALASADFDVPQRAFYVFLPEDGPSWVCDCTPGQPHRCAPNERRPDLRVPLRTPRTVGIGRLRVAISFRNNIVLSSLLTADITESSTESGAHLAVTDYSLTADLTDLDAFSPRTLSVLTNEALDGSHTFVFQDGEVPPFTLSFSEGQLTDAMSDVRAELLRAHIDFSGPSPRDRLQPRNRKGRDELITDLGRLAELGFGLWTALFQQTGSDLTRARPLAGGTVQIARVPSSAFVFPWAAVYQRPPGPPPYELCPLLAEWDGDSSLFEGAPPRCPFEEQHGRERLLCPFDFWGYRFAIEHPPSIRDRRLDRVVHVVDPPELAIAASSVLDAAETRRHFDALRDGLAGFAIGPAAETVFDVGRSLSASDLAIVYFYCHGGGAVGGDPWLEVAEGERISPTTITTWYLSDWPEQHWESTHPIVLLNGCHTAELLPQSPVNFVDVFTAVNASGVIGTEITLHQRVAGEAAEVLLSHFGGANPLPVGESLRRTRLEFLRKGNILGLAYTAYCAAELRLVRDAAA